jgi:hypothetical protein
MDRKFLILILILLLIISYSSRIEHSTEGKQQHQKRSSEQQDSITLLKNVLKNGGRCGCGYVGACEEVGNKNTLIKIF